MVIYEVSDASRQSFSIAYIRHTYQTPIRKYLNLGSRSAKICKRENPSRDKLATWTREARAKSMLVIRIVQLQFLFLCIFLVCESIAGTKNGPFWFALVAITLVALTVAGKIVRRSR
jgi:hypothetical protein